MARQAALSMPSVSDLTNALLSEWAQKPTDPFQNLMENPPRRVETIIDREGRCGSFLLIAVILEWNGKQADIVGMIVRCLHTFVHIVEGFLFRKRKRF